MISRRIHPVLFVLGATALVGALGGTAFAGESAETSATAKARAKVQQVTLPFQLPPQATNLGVADSSLGCPGGTTLVGGGATFDPTTPLTTNIELFKSGPFENSWNVRYNNNEATGQLASVAAICLKKNLKVTGEDGKPTAKSKVRQVVQQVQLPADTATSNGVAETNVNCPGSTKLLGGGASFSSTDPALRVTLFESGPQGNAWHVRYDNDGTIAQPATVTAICLKSKLKVKGGDRAAKARSKVQQVSQQVQLPPQAIDNGVAQFDISCPGDTKVVGGGGLFPAGSPLTTNIELFESGPRGNGWHVRFNAAGAVFQAASIHALCLRKNLKVK